MRRIGRWKWSFADLIFGFFDEVEVELGKEIYVDTAKTSDWLYIEKGKLVGGYTLRVDYNKMHDSDKRKLEAELGCKIE